MREVCTHEKCGKCSPGVSDTLGVRVRPVGVYVGDVVLLQLWWGAGDDSCHSVPQFALEGSAVKANASCVHSSGDSRL